MKNFLLVFTSGSGLANREAAKCQHQLSCKYILIFDNEKSVSLLHLNINNQNDSILTRECKFRLKCITDMGNFSEFVLIVNRIFAYVYAKLK